MSSRLSAVSLFSGCGGFDIGAQAAGVEIVWANDVDEDAAAAYKAIFPDVEFVLGDVREVRSFPEADVLIGCYPCTGFSLGSRRKWHGRKSRNLLEDEDNFLFREFVRAIGQVKPRYLFVENVPGMASANDGWFLEMQCSGFRALGYKTEHVLLDSSFYGVPQRRKRIFIVGVLDGAADDRYDFPKPTHGPTAGKPILDMQSAIGIWDEWPIGEFFDYPFHGHYLTRNRKRDWSEPSYTIVADAHHVPLHPVGEPMTFVMKDQWTLNGSLNRRLSWRECAALQALPASLELPGSIKKKYRIVGNAVPPPVATALLRQMTGQ